MGVGLGHRKGKSRHTNRRKTSMKIAINEGKLGYHRNY